MMLPKMSGIDVCRTIRQTSSTPIIMLTAKGEEIDRILGLELGADDYIVKPFSPREVLARIKAVLRRFSEKAAEEDSSIVRLPQLEISLENYQVKAAGKVIPCTPQGSGDFAHAHFKRWAGVQSGADSLPCVGLRLLRETRAPWTRTSRGSVRSFPRRTSRGRSRRFTESATASRLTGDMKDKSVLTKRVVIFSAIVALTAVAGMLIAGLILALSTAMPAWADVLLGALIGALFASAAGYMLVSYFIRDAVRPITALRDAAVKIAGGALEARASEKAPGELGELGRAINNLSYQLSYNMYQLILERNRLKQMLDNLSEGIVAVDAEGKLTPHESRRGRAHGGRAVTSPTRGCTV